MPLQNLNLRECLYAGEEGQVERAGDLDGLQCEGGRVEGERDWVNHLGVHQQLGALAAVSQTRLEGGHRREILMHIHFCLRSSPTRNVKIH